MQIARALNLSLASVLLFGGGGDLCCVENPITGQPSFILCSSEVLPKGFPPIFGCVAAQNIGTGEGEVTPQVTLLDLSNKALPLALRDDEDVKDIRLKKGKFPTEPKKRARLISKKDGGAGAYSYDLAFSGLFSSSITLGFDKTTGFVDAESAGYFEITDTTSAGEGEELGFTRMTATWDETSGGLLVSAETQDGPLGTPVQFGPTDTQISLRISRLEGSLQLEAFSLGGGFEEGFPSFFFEQLGAPDDTQFVGTFGVQGLGKKGQFFFHELTVQATDMGITSGIVGAAIAGAVALETVENAWEETLNPFAVNIPSVNANLDLGLQAIGAAATQLETAMESESVHGSAQTKLAIKSAVRMMKRGAKAAKLGDKLVEQESPKTKALSNKANRARWAAQLHLAQLFGYKSQSVGKLFNTIQIYLGT